MKTLAIVTLYVFTICVFAYAGVKIQKWAEHQHNIVLHQKEENVVEDNKPVGHIPMPIVEKSN